MELCGRFVASWRSVQCQEPEEGMVARQFMLGVVQTAEGLPIYHEVFDGNQSETATLLPTIRKVLARYPHIRKLIIVADRGLLSLDNLEELLALKLDEGQTLEFILAVPARRYGEFHDILQRFNDTITDQENETINECRWQDLRLVVAHNPQTAQALAHHRGATGPEGRT